MKTEPTEQALAAARALRTADINLMSHGEVASLIDSKTNLPALLEENAALKEALKLATVATNDWRKILHSDRRNITIYETTPDLRDSLTRLAGHLPILASKKATK